MSPEDEVVKSNQMAIESAIKELQVGSLFLLLLVQQQLIH